MRSLTWKEICVRANQTDLAVEDVRLIVDAATRLQHGGSIRDVTKFLVDLHRKHCHEMQDGGAVIVYGMVRYLLPQIQEGLEKNPYMNRGQYLDACSHVCVFFAEHQFNYDCIRDGQDSRRRLWEFFRACLNDEEIRSISTTIPENALPKALVHCEQWQLIKEYAVVAALGAMHPDADAAIDWLNIVSLMEIGHWELKYKVRGLEQAMRTDPKLRDRLESTMQSCVRGCENALAGSAGYGAAYYETQLVLIAIVRGYLARHS